MESTIYIMIGEKDLLGFHQWNYSEKQIFVVLNFQYCALWELSLSGFYSLANEESGNFFHPPP